MTCRKLGRRLERRGELGVVGQRWSGMVSSLSESSHREGAAEISSTRVLGAEMDIVSCVVLFSGGSILTSMELCKTGCSRFVS